MKKIVAVAVSILFLVSFTFTLGCKKSEEGAPSGTTAPEKSAPSGTTTAPPAPEKPAGGGTGAPGGGAPGGPPAAPEKK